MRRRMAAILGTIAVVTAVLATPAAAGGRSCQLPRFGPGRQYHPHIDPASFSPNVTNRFFPLRPGRTLVYTGTKDGEPVNVQVNIEMAWSPPPPGPG